MSASDGSRERQNGFWTQNVGRWERLASVAGGGALAYFGLARRRSLGDMALAIVGTNLVFRGVTGFSPTYKVLGKSTARGMQGHSPVASVAHGQGIKVERTVTINRSPEELYRFWRNFENLPRIMSHLESVRVIDDRRSHWEAKAPLGKQAGWDAQIINESPGEMIAWRSLDNADIGNAGSVWFRPAPGRRGTEVKVTLEYDPPAGKLGQAFAKLFGEEPDQQVADDLRRFKQLMETGEVATIEGQPSARPSDKARRAERNERVSDTAPASALDVVQRSALTTGPLDVVQQASEESFPASDPPTWSQGTTEARS